MKTIINLIYLLLFLQLSTCFTHLEAQTHRKVIFEKLTPENGLPHPILTGIAADTMGLIWIGTKNGLVRYDGINVRTFHHNKFDSSSLKWDAIQSMLMVKETNNLYISSTLGLSRLDINTEKFHNYYQQNNKTMPVPHKFLRNIYRMHNYLILDYDDSWYLFNIENDSIEANISDHLQGYAIEDLVLIDNDIAWFTADNSKNLLSVKLSKQPEIIKVYLGNIKPGIFNSRFTDITVDKYGTHYIANNGLYRIEKNKKIETAQYIEVFNNKKFRDEHQLEIKQLDIDNRGNLYIATISNGLVVYNTVSGEVSYPQLNSAQTFSTREMQVQNIKVDKNQRVWFSAGYTLSEYLPDERQIIKYSYNPFDRHSFSEKGLSRNALNHLFVDNNNVYWFIGQGTVNYTNFEKSKFNLLNEEEGIISNNVWGITSDHKGRLWVGARRGISIYDQQMNEIKNFLFGFNELPDMYDEITDILEIAPDTFLVATTADLNLVTYQNGPELLHKYEGNHKNELYKTPFWGMREVTYDKSGNIWVSGSRGVFQFIKPSQNNLYGKIKSFPTSRELTDTTFRQSITWSVYEDSHNYMWIATGEGLSRRNMRTGKFIHYIPGNDPTNFNSINPKAFAEDSLGNIWIATEGNGLFYYNYDTDVFTNFTAETGSLSTNQLLSVFLDNKGILWMSSADGIIMFDPGKPGSINFGIKDGLQAKQFKAGSFYKDTLTGIMYFGGNYGLNFFHPSDIEVSTYAPRLIFTELTVFNKHAGVNEKINGQRILTKAMPYVNELTFNHKNYIFKVSFKALDYSDPERIRYRYKLEGFEEGYTTVNAENAATSYTNLAPGTYRLSVQSTNSDGIWIENTNSLNITILPPWWLTWWFRLIVTLVIIAGILLFIQQRTRALINQRKKLRQKVQDRTRELAQKNKQLRHQASKLSEANSLLEERQQFIKKQNEELQSQKEQLLEQNTNLEVSNKTKDRLFSIIAHDLKSPFNIILGFISLIDQRIDNMDKAQIKEKISMINSSAKNVFQLLENLLQWAGSQTGSINYHPSEIEIHHILNDELNLVKPGAEKKSIIITLEGERDMYAYADLEMIRTVFRNLLSNAIKFTPEKGKITLKLKKDTKNKINIIRIIDTGVGIPNETLEKLFLPDEKITTAGTQGEKGTGLGLILVKEFVEKNNGTLEIETIPGKGSEFSITLPGV